MPPLEVGQEVRVAPLQRHQSWKTGTCVEKLSDRSYLVKTSERTVRRNRHFLRTQEQPVSKPKVDPLTYSLTRDNLISTRTISAMPPTPTKTDHCERPVSETLPEATTPASSNVPAQQAEQRTRTRIVKKPAKFQDFVY